MMTRPDSPLTRREALRRTLLGGLAASTAAILPNAEAGPAPEPRTDAPFIPENDYPFFGYEPEQAS